MQTVVAAIPPMKAAPATEAPGALNLKPLRDALRELETAARRAKDLQAAYGDLLTDVASKSGVAASVSARLSRTRFHGAESVWRWRQCVLDSGLPAPTRQVLLTLAHHMRDGDPSCFTSPRSLMGETGLAVDAVSAALREALAAGLIEVRAAEGRNLCMTRLIPE